MPCIERYRDRNRDVVNGGVLWFAPDLGVWLWTHSGGVDVVTHCVFCRNPLPQTEHLAPKWDWLKHKPKPWEGQAQWPDPEE